jgi:hypothetical protein
MNSETDRTLAYYTEGLEDRGREMNQQKSSSPLAVFPNSDGSRVPYKVFSEGQI